MREFLYSCRRTKIGSRISISSSAMAMMSSVSWFVRELNEDSG